MNVLWLWALLYPSFSELPTVVTFYGGRQSETPNPGGLVSLTIDFGFSCPRGTALTTTLLDFNK